MSHCPADILKCIAEASELLSINPNAAANRIRVAIEHLLTHQKIARSRINKKHKRDRLTLHKRIELFGEKNAPASDLLLAVKWISNDGSHESGLSQIDFIKGVQLFDYALKTIFDKDNIELKKLAKKVNSQKGVRNSQTKSAF